MVVVPIHNNITININYISIFLNSSVRLKCFAFKISIFPSDFPEHLSKPTSVYSLFPREVMAVLIFYLKRVAAAHRFPPLWKDCMIYRLQPIRSPPGERCEQMFLFMNIEV